MRGRDHTTPTRMYGGTAQLQANLPFRLEMFCRLQPPASSSSRKGKKPDNEQLTWWPAGQQRPLRPLQQAQSALTDPPSLPCPCPLGQLHAQAREPGALGPKRRRHWCVFVRVVDVWWTTHAYIRIRIPCISMYSYVEPVGDGIDLGAYYSSGAQTDSSKMCQPELGCSRITWGAVRYSGQH